MEKIEEIEEMEKKNTFIAGLLSKITILENKMTLAVQNELAKVHTKSTDVIQQISTWFSNNFTDTGAKKVKGGSKSRQNKQQYQKKYTKRYKKKIYRKRTQKHLKIKRRRHTKRRK